jgi:3-deoxy-D-manno-octulosonic-acid transferase
MYLLYSALLAVALLVTLPYWIWQALAQGKYRKGFGERWGRVPARLRDAPSQRLIWIHAVSVGEVLAVSGLVKLLAERNNVVVSTTTDTGQALARERFGAENVFYFPLDFGFAITPYLKALKPRLVVLAETEFWPNFLRLARNSGARVAVVNARISDRSLPGYRRWRFVLKPVLQNVELFLAQTGEDRERLISIGASPERVRVSGNLKFDVAPPASPPIVAEMRAALQKDGVGPVLVCGSTVEGEEALLLSSFEKVASRHPKAFVILAPRRPERFSDVAALLQQRGFDYCRRSAWNGNAPPGKVMLLDSIGELAALYALADVAFVGGSLVPRGGHNILEPARFGVAIMVGPHTGNFRDVIELFGPNGALRITDGSRLSEDLLELLSDSESRAALGRRAAETLARQTGATERTLTELRELMERR